MKKNGYTLVELLGVVTILGILSVLTIGGYSRYKHRASVRAYEILSESSASAAEDYYLDNVTAGETVDLETLVNEEYLENLTDPWDKNSKCVGQVIRKKTGSKGIVKANGKELNGIDAYSYDVELKCSRGCKCITYPEKSSCTCEKYK